MGGLEGPVSTPTVTRHMGGLEGSIDWLDANGWVTRHMGGLEVEQNHGIARGVVTRHMGGLEDNY